MPAQCLPDSHGMRLTMDGLRAVAAEAAALKVRPCPLRGRLPPSMRQLGLR